MIHFKWCLHSDRRSSSAIRTNHFAIEIGTAYCWATGILLEHQVLSFKPELQTFSGLELAKVTGILKRFKHFQRGTDERPLENTRKFRREGR